MHAGMLQTEEVIIRVAEADKDDVDEAVNAARKAFDEGTWPRTPGAQRGLVLNKCASLPVSLPTRATISCTSLAEIQAPCKVVPTLASARRISALFLCPCTLKPLLL